jgi:hypothetical protein
LQSYDFPAKILYINKKKSTTEKPVFHVGKLAQNNPTFLSRFERESGGYCLHEKRIVFTAICVFSAYFVILTK